MGLFSFFFSKNKFRTTHEAEASRMVFRQNEELFQRIEQSEELKRFKIIEKQINSEEFKRRRKEIEHLSYKGSPYYEAEKEYKSLLKIKKLQSYQLIRTSQELKGYEDIIQTDAYQQYIKVKTVVQAADFDEKLHADEYALYQKLVKQPKIAAAIKFEKLKRYKEYCEVKNSDLPEKFEKLVTFVRSDEFKANRKYLLDKNRYKTTEDYKLLEEYEELKKHKDLIKYNSLLTDSYFNDARKWQLVFEDEFDQGTLNKSKWISRYYAGERFLNDTYGVGKDVQLFTADNISFQESAVKLHFRKESIIGKYWDQKVGIREKKYDYTSAMLSTALSFKQQYGRFEAKIKLNHAALTTCFWMLGDTDVPHVEIMKCQDGSVYMGQMYSHGMGIKSDIQQLKNMALKPEYYIFTLEWTKEKMVWMVNDMIVKEVRENLPNSPMYVILSLGAQENPTDKDLPVTMEIDWVRGYRLKE